MTTQEGKGVEIVDANASVSASAATQPIDKKQITVSARAAGADVDPIAEEGDVEVNKLGKAGGDTGPYDEAPITRVDEHPDDVSSLHHDVDGKPDRYRGGEDAIAEGDEYYDAQAVMDNTGNNGILMEVIDAFGVLVVQTQAEMLGMMDDPTSEGKRLRGRRVQDGSMGSLAPVVVTDIREYLACHRPRGFLFFRFPNNVTAHTFCPLQIISLS